MSNLMSLDVIRVPLVVALAVGQALMAYWPELRGWPETISSRSARYSTPIVPVGWAFAVWGLIFVACMAFAIWQALPVNHSDPLLRTLGWLAIAIFTINIAWEHHVPTKDIDWVSVALIVLALVTLLAALWQLDLARPHDRATFLLAAVPFQLFAGWISAATFVNLSSTLRRSGVSITPGLSLLLLGASVTLAGTVAFWSQSLIYALVICWALFGIAVANRRTDANRAVRVVAASLIPVAPALALLGAP